MYIFYVVHIVGKVTSMIYTSMIMKIGTIRKMGLSQSNSFPSTVYIIYLIILTKAIFKFIKPRYLILFFDISVK